MADEISAQYQGKLRCKATRGPAGPAVQTDVGVDHGGQGEFLSPLEMAVAAVETCAMSMLAVTAERNGVDLSKARATAQFETKKEAATMRIGSVRLTFHLPGDVPAPVRPKLEAAAKACPVKNSLHPDVRTDMEFVYG
jgi:putative redox protein